MTDLLEGRRLGWAVSVVALLCPTFATADELSAPDRGARSWGTCHLLDSLHGVNRLEERVRAATAEATHRETIADLRGDLARVTDDAQSRSAAEQARREANRAKEELLLVERAAAREVVSCGNLTLRLSVFQLSGPRYRYRFAGGMQDRVAATPKWYAFDTSPKSPFHDVLHQSDAVGARFFDVGVGWDLFRWNLHSEWALSFATLGVSVALADTTDLVATGLLLGNGQPRAAWPLLARALLPVSLRLDALRVRSPWRWEASLGTAVELRPFGGELVVTPLVLALGVGW